MFGVEVAYGGRLVELHNERAHCIIDDAFRFDAFVKVLLVWRSLYGETVGLREQFNLLHLLLYFKKNHRLCYKKAEEGFLLSKRNLCLLFNFYGSFFFYMLYSRLC